MMERKRTGTEYQAQISDMANRIEAWLRANPRRRPTFRITYSGTIGVVTDIRPAKEFGLVEADAYAIELVEAVRTWYPANLLPTFAMFENALASALNRVVA